MPPKWPTAEIETPIPSGVVAGQEPKVRKLSTVTGRPHYCAPQARRTTTYAVQWAARERVARERAGDSPHQQAKLIAWAGRPPRAL
jgi:hypothetical protein